MSATAASQKLINPSNTSSKNRYRPEIDGLRAFAVVAVIINHFNKELLPSGYLGVDIFFVISGFVITSSLATKFNTNTLEFLKSFYARRCKRLLPTLIAFTIVTSILITLVNPNPGNYLLTGMSGLFGVSNIYLYSNATDYFAQSAELNPFLHTWSLGVEEQFYLLFPLIACFTGFTKQPKNQYSQKLFFAIISGIAALSFLYFYRQNQVDQPAAYFLMPARFWEIALGCLVFQCIQSKKIWINQLTRIPPSAILALMAGTMFLRPDATVLTTLSITLLTGALIAIIKPGTSTYTALTRKEITYVGLISYSLYLWHGLVIAWSRWTIGIHWWSAPLQILMMLALASISYRYIEQPFRNTDHSNKRIFLISGASLFLSALFGLGTFHLRKYIFMGGENVYKNNQTVHHLDLNGNTSNKLFVLGDSHAGALAGLLEKLNQANGYTIKMHSRGANLPKQFQPKNKENFLESGLEYYKPFLRSGDIILSIKNYQADTWSSDFKLDEDEKAARFASKNGLKLILFRPIPFFEDLRPYRECYQAWFRPLVNDPKSNCTSTKDRAVLKNQFQRVFLAQNELAAQFPGTVEIFDAFTQLCPKAQKNCSTTDAIDSLYKDDDHISHYGAQKMHSAFIQFLDNKIHN